MVSTPTASILRRIGISIFICAGCHQSSNGGSRRWRDRRAAAGPRGLPGTAGRSRWSAGRPGSSRFPEGDHAAGPRGQVRLGRHPGYQQLTEF